MSQMKDCLPAISNALSYATPKSYDSLLSSSLLPEQALVDQAILIAHAAPAQSHPEIITKGATVKPMMHKELLTASQHKQLIDKVCTCFEYEGLHLTDCRQWLALKPKSQQWTSACQITQHWDLTMKMCCTQDLQQ